MADALQQVVADKNIRGLLLTGAEAVDLDESLDKYYNPLIRRIRSMAIPVVCAVNGVAASAGANISLACDTVIAAATAKLIQSFCKVGLLPDSGGMWVLPRLVGMAGAKALSMLGTVLSANDAAQWGLIYETVPAVEFDREARRWSSNLASQATETLAAVRFALGQGINNDPNTHLNLERDTQSLVVANTDRPEDVLGLHFFSPAHTMRLLEIVRGEKTSEEVINSSLAFSERLGKLGVVVGNYFGFVGNRTLVWLRSRESVPFT